MALYEYECTRCSHRFERLQKSGARAPKCPECAGKTKRQISAPAIQFKGTGWYLTDYARKGRKDPGAKGEPTKSEAKKGASGEGDKKAGDKKGDG